MTPTPETLSAKILAERDKGNAVLVELDGLYTVPVSTLVDQPADGILYDLNRLEEVALTFLPDTQWVNNFAVALVVRELKAQLASSEQARQTVEKKLKDVVGVFSCVPETIRAKAWHDYDPDGTIRDGAYLSTNALKESP